MAGPETIDPACAELHSRADFGLGAAMADFIGVPEDFMTLLVPALRVTLAGNDSDHWVRHHVQNTVKTAPHSSV